MKKLHNAHIIKVKFVIVGIWNTIFGYALFYLLDTLFEGIFAKQYYAYMFAMVLSYVVGIINAYIFHKLITFQSLVRGKGIIDEFYRFAMTYIVTLCLSLILLPLFVEILHMHPRVAAIFILGICTVVSYLGHSAYSFRSAKN